MVPLVLSLLPTLGVLVKHGVSGGVLAQLLVQVLSVWVLAYAAALVALYWSCGKKKGADATPTWKRALYTSWVAPVVLLVYVIVIQVLKVTPLMEFGVILDNRFVECLVMYVVSCISLNGERMASCKQDESWVGSLLGWL
jgi:hypothetical protein